MNTSSFSQLGIEDAIPSALDLLSVELALLLSCSRSCSCSSCCFTITALTVRKERERERAKQFIKASISRLRTYREVKAVRRSNAPEDNAASWLPDRSL